MTRRGCLLLCVLLLATPARAIAKDSTADKLVKQLVAALDDGEIKNAATWWNDAAQALLRKNVEHTYAVVSALRWCVAKRAEAAFDRKPYAQLVARALSMSAHVLKQQPRSRRAGFARGHALRASGWLRFYEGVGGVEPWDEAFTTLTAIAQHDAWSGGTIEVAAGYLHEAAGLDGAPADALLARAATATKGAFDANPLHFRALGAYAWTRYLQAERAVESGSKADAKAWAKEALETARAAAEAESDRQSMLLTDYHWIARFADREKFVKSPDMLTRTRKSRFHYVSYELPRGKHWRVKHSKDKDAELLTTLTRTDRGGVATVKFYRYWWSTNYRSGDAVAGGDNVKGLMEQARTRDVKWLKKVKRQRKVVRGRLSRTVPKTSGYEVLGETEGGSKYWTRGWYFKSEYKEATIAIVVSHQGEHAGFDAELEYLVTSTTQLPKEDK